MEMEDLRGERIEVGARYATYWIDIDRNGMIVDAPSVARRWIGSPVRELYEWLKKRDMFVSWGGEYAMVRDAENKTKLDEKVKGLRESCGLRRVEGGERECLKCGQKFTSRDLRVNKMCRKCAIGK